MDKDGTFTYSPIIKSNCASPTVQLQVYPIPSNNEMNVYIQSNKSNAAIIKLIDMYGKTIMQLGKSLSVRRNNATLNVVALSAGTYFLKVQTLEWIKRRR